MNYNTLKFIYNDRSFILVKDNAYDSPFLSATEDFTGTTKNNFLQGVPKNMCPVYAALQRSCTVNSSGIKILAANRFVRKGRSFLILGTGAEDFLQGYETYSICGSTNILRAILMGYKTILLEKNLDELMDQRLKEKLREICNI